MSKTGYFDISDTSLDLDETLDTVTSFFGFGTNDELRKKRNRQAMKAEAGNPTESLNVSLSKIGPQTTIKDPKIGRPSIDLETLGNNHVDLVRLANANFQKEANIFNAVFSGDTADDTLNDFEGERQIRATIGQETMDALRAQTQSGL